jgi:MarR family transcriptional regulator for hemolysin
MDRHNLHDTRRSELEKRFISTLCPLREKLRRCFDHELTAFGLSRALAAPLVLISRADGIRQRELARQLDIEGPSLVRLLDQLNASGLVVRRQDPDDQRGKTLHLTPAGAELVRRITPVSEELRANLLAGASTNDLEATVRTIAKFLSNCEQQVMEVTK